MKNPKPIIEQSLSDKADERAKREGGRTMATAAGWLASIGLAISALLTTIYLMLLVDDAAGLPSPYGLMFGLLVGLVAVVPAELAMVIWRARLNSEMDITAWQKRTAVFAMIAAGVFSALTTSSFFSYFLPQLFPGAYQTIAPSLNVAAIVGSWIVFILAMVGYGINSRQTQQNLSQAESLQSIFDARMSVVKSAGEAIRIEAENMVEELDKAGVFKEDARRLILASLGMEESRIALPAPAPQKAVPPTIPGHPLVAGLAAEAHPAPANLEPNVATVGDAPADDRGDYVPDVTPEQMENQADFQRTVTDYLVNLIKTNNENSAENFTNGRSGQGQ